jgi:hypothetical protein
VDARAQLLLRLAIAAAALVLVAASPAAAASGPTDADEETTYLAPAGPMFAVPVVDDHESPLITGGGAVDNPGWIVAVFKDFSYICTGVLIDPHVVLTAAHCAEEPASYQLLFGTESLLDPGIQRTASTVQIHPGWSGDLGDTDLALIGFDSPVTSLPVVPLNTKPLWPEWDQPVSAAGWGEYGPSTGPSLTLNGADFWTTSGMDGTVDSDYCDLNPGEVTAGGVFCFGGPVLASACAGDSGGPVVGWATPSATDGPLVVYGLVSYGPVDCGAGTVDSKAQAVGAHSFWITTMVERIKNPPPPPPGHTTGLVDPSRGKWFLFDDVGIATASFYYGDPGDYPFVGDWDGDGVETPGLYRQSDGYVYLRNSNTQGNADIKFFFGDPGDVPIAGDFNNDGFDTVSIYRPSNQTFYIINKLGSGDQGLGAADLSYVFGNPGDKPFVGDFDGDGVETAGLHRESTGLVYFRNSHTQGNADAQFIFGDPGDRLIAGDWTADGTFTPALFRPSNTTMYFRHTNTQGNADDEFIPIPTNASWLPIAGKMN